MDLNRIRELSGLAPIKEATSIGQVATWSKKLPQLLGNIDDLLIKKISVNNRKVSVN